MSAGTAHDGRHSAVDEVVDQLKSRIRSGVWAAGDRLPAERNLAAELNVSRNTVREALGALALTRAVKIRPGSGAFVNQLTPDLIFDPVKLVVDMSPAVSTPDLLAVRRVVEAETTSRAAACMRPEQLRELEVCLEAMAGTAVSVDDVEAMTELDVRFHQIINEASGNPALAALGASLNSWTFRARVWRGYADEGIADQAHSEHASILAAVRDGDPARGSTCAAAHVAGVEGFLRRALADDDTEGRSPTAPPPTGTRQVSNRGRGSATEVTVERLKDMIASGRWSVGDRIPPERTLAARLGVSRNTVREALGVLEQMRAVEIKRGSGTFVTDLAAATLRDAVTTMVETSSSASLIDLLALRRIVEAEAASRAAVLITDEQLRDLDERLARMSAAVADEPDEVKAALDLEFHRAVTEAAANPVFSALVSALNGTTFHVRVSAGWYRSAGFPAEAERQHAGIVAALRDRDPSRAGALAGAHVASVERFLRAASLDA